MPLFSHPTLTSASSDFFSTEPRLLPSSVFLFDSVDFCSAGLFRFFLSFVCAFQLATFRKLLNLSVSYAAYVFLSAKSTRHKMPPKSLEHAVGNELPWEVQILAI